MTFYLGLNFFKSKAKLQTLVWLFYWGHVPRKQEWGSGQSE